MDTKYIVIIDTDQYAGNFEREMCAFCTGVVGDCGVGEEARDKFVADYDEDFADEMWGLLELVADEHGTMRPCAIHPTPGFFSNGLGGRI